MIQRGRIGTLVLLLLTVACSGGGSTATPGTTPRTTPGTTPTIGTAEPGSPFTEVTESILGIIPAAGIGEDGQPIDPAFRFSADADQITTVVQAGEIAGSSMDITWFQVTGDGELELFTHTVAVVSYQAAYSVGANPGTLTAATYRVEAALDGDVLSTTFDVENAESGVVARVGGFIGEGATAGPPESGDSGAMDTTVSDTPQSGQPVVGVFVVSAPVDPNAQSITLLFDAIVPGGNRNVVADVTMGGNMRSISFALVVGADRLRHSLDFNPCAHPGGSDLPGTPAEFTVSVFEGDLALPLARASEPTVLGPDETRPEVTINSDPPNGSKVEVGDEIVLDATAQEIPGGSTWQEGLNSFKLIANPGGMVGEEQRSVAGSAQPCDAKQWNLRVQATHTVPDDAPGIFTICGEALDFAGNFSDPNACNRYFTGEVWEGAVTGQTTQPGCEPATTPISGWLEIVVDGDGAVTGSATEGRARFSCGGTEVPAYEQTWPVTGVKSEEAFELLIDQTPLTLPISETQATATVDRPGAGGYGAVTTYTISCVTCE